MTQPMPTKMPPNATTNLGPRRGPRTSAIHPWMGVSHVSSAMKMLNANWIDASDQPCALLIGLTNSVQPYCRLAIRIMQRMQQISCVHRTPTDAEARSVAACDVVVISSPLL